MSKNSNSQPTAQALDHLPQFSARWISQLRHGLGLSRADFARRLQPQSASGCKVSWEDVANWEGNRATVPAELHGILFRMSHQSEAFNERTRLRPIAESAMAEFKLTQIEAHDLDELEERLADVRPGKASNGHGG
jgi:DNA-binding transcriptional regulator YiaG